MAGKDLSQVPACVSAYPTSVCCSAPVIINQTTVNSMTSSNKCSVSICFSMSNLSDHCVSCMETFTRNAQSTINFEVYL